MPNPFFASLAQNFDEGLRLMDAALRDCPDALWETDMFPDAPTAAMPDGGLHGSAPWFLGYHALTVLDYDLSGEFESSWRPPEPFDDNTWSFPNRVFTQPELLGYVEYCAGRVRDTLHDLTAAAVETPMPSTHRYGGTLYGVILGSLPLHTIEHAAQIRQFLTTSGVKVRPVPGDQGFNG